MGYPYVGPVVHDSGTGNLPIGRIVIHCTAGGSDGSGAPGTANYFKNPAAGGSAHAVVDSDEVLICAHDNVVCWHAPPNDGSYGIEIVCSLANEGKGHWTLPSHVSAMKLAAKLAAEKCVQHKIPPVRLTVADLKAGKRGITGHVDVSNAFHQSSHWDPGPWFPWDQFMGYVRAEYAALTKTTPTPAPPTGEFTVDQADRVIAAMQEIQRTTEGGRYAQIITEARAQEKRLTALLTTLTAAVNALAAKLPKV